MLEAPEEFSAAAKVVKEANKPAPKKPKLVRDSFTFPKTDYALIATLKQRMLQAGREIKKSEILRAGLAVLSGLSDQDVLQVREGVERIKTGRPSK